MRRVTAAPAPESEAALEFDDNALLPALYGEADQHLRAIERALGVALVGRGNRVQIAGPAQPVRRAKAVLTALYDRLRRGYEIAAADLDLLLESEAADYHPLAAAGEEPEIRTRKRRIAPRSPGQIAYVRALRDHLLTFGLGPAGTGKTYLAVATAVDMLMSGKVGRINFQDLLVVHCKVLADENAAACCLTSQKMIRNPFGRSFSAAQNSYFGCLQQLKIESRILFVDAYNTGVGPVNPDARKCGLDRADTWNYPAASQAETLYYQLCQAEQPGVSGDQHSDTLTIRSLGQIIQCLVNVCIHSNALSRT